MPQSTVARADRTVETSAAKSATERIVSLDAFRGLTMALMVLVNNPGRGADSYAQLRHSEWHGWTATDTVFPSFVWIVGVAITLSLGKRLAQGIPRSKLMLQVLRRAVILFLLGMSIYAFPHFNLETQRILGVLQRIAVCYFCASAIFLFFSVRGQMLWLAGVLAAYWALMTLVPVPGYGTGHWDIPGNFAHYIDHMVLGSHNYHSTKDWDPEGVVSTLPAIGTALFGLLAGRLIQMRRTIAQRAEWLVAIGVVLLAAGLIWNQWMPINKKIWTDSFCFFMAGLDFLIFGTFFWLVDGLGWRKPVKPLVIMGMNAIAVYLVSEFGAEILDAIQAGNSVPLQHWIYRTVYAPLASPANASLLYSLSFTALMFLVAYLLYRRRWFIRV